MDHLLFDRSQRYFQFVTVCDFKTMAADAIGLGSLDQFKHVESVIRVGTQAGQVAAKVL
ncbi:hypothetical protein D3C81_1487200 [compost metagenome]